MQRYDGTPRISRCVSVKIEIARFFVDPASKEYDLCIETSPGTYWVSSNLIQSEIEMIYSVIGKFLAEQ